MGYTLVEAAVLSHDKMLSGIIETIYTESQVLEKLPFEEISGTALRYTRESTLPTAGFYAVGDNWTESTGTHTEHSASLTILGGDSDVDEFLKKTYSNVNDIEATAIEEKAKAVARKFDHEFIYGATATNPKGFDGLHALVGSAFKVNQGTTATGAALSLANLDKLIDLIQPGKPDFLIMNRTMRRRLGAFYRSNAGSPQARGTEGTRMKEWADIPILTNDWITQTETIATSTYSAETGSNTTSIFAVKFGSKLVSGLQNGGVTKEKIGKLETKDATRWRIKWYCSLACFNTMALAQLDGITDAVVVV